MRVGNGRSVYSPMFGGVYWDSQDVFLEDIDRIEVIGGPGGSLWGGERGKRNYQQHHKARGSDAGDLVNSWQRHFGTGLRYGPV